MPLLLKDPAAAIDYAIDWSSDYLDGDILAASDWTIKPDEPGGLVVLASQLSDGTTTVTLGGGEVGKVYQAFNRVETAAGAKDRRSITIRVEQR